MITTLVEAEDYLRELESKPVGYGNKFTTDRDFLKMREAFRWAVGELKTLQEKLEEESYD